MAETKIGDGRPSPKALLQLAEQETRGKLKVFLGMAPGVGKTYAMLSAARTQRAEGTDLVVGVVETHGRPETAALLEGLEVLPRRPVFYRRRSLMEFDVEAAIARRPKLLLVDEFAHTNAPGLIHVKRYQDVEEVLRAGIDVWTTLNIQHLESLTDVVERIAGIRVQETVPADPDRRLGSRAHRRCPLSPRLHLPASAKARASPAIPGTHTDRAGDWISARGR